jgi:hypothetical protein
MRALDGAVAGSYPTTFLSQAIRANRQRRS